MVTSIYYLICVYSWLGDSMLIAIGMYNTAHVKKLKAGALFTEYCLPNYGPGAMMPGPDQGRSIAAEPPSDSNHCSTAGVCGRSPQRGVREAKPPGFFCIWEHQKHKNGKQQGLKSRPKPKTYHFFLKMPPKQVKFRIFRKKNPIFLCQIRLAVHETWTPWTRVGGAFWWPKFKVFRLPPGPTFPGYCPRP